MPILVWEEAVHEKNMPGSGEVAAIVNGQMPVEHESLNIKICCINEGIPIAREAKSANKEMAGTKWPTIVEDSLDDILLTSFHIEKCCIRLVLYIAVKQVMLNVVRKDGT